MMVKDIETGNKVQCMHAAKTILDLIRYECQGFILPPAEVKNLLGIERNDMAWYLSKRIKQLKKILANNFIAMEISPEKGVSVMLYQAPAHTFIAFSPRKLSKM